MELQKDVQTGSDLATSHSRLDFKLLILSNSVSDYKSNSGLTPSLHWLSSTSSDQGGGSPVASLLQHGEAVQRGGDVLRADAGQLAQLPYGDLAVADLVEALQHHAAPVGHVGEAAQVRQRLLRRARLAFALGQQVACRAKTQAAGE